MKSASVFAIAFAVASYLSLEVHGQCQQCNSPNSVYQSCECQNGDPTFCQSFARWYRSVYDMNAMWPRPYVMPARNSVNVMYEAMVSNGWRRQNLLGKHHFDEDTQQLTQAGKLKVKWILTQVPPQRRNIYVERGVNESHTAIRIESIHQHTASMSPVQGPVSVTDTHLVSEGHPAAAVDAMFTGYQANKPAPMLPAANSGTEESN